jgi:hypothetical protein
VAVRDGFVSIIRTLMSDRAITRRMAERLMGALGNLTTTRALFLKTVPSLPQPWGLSSQSAAARRPLHLN